MKLGFEIMMLMYINYKTYQKYFATILLIMTIFAIFADAKGRASLSYGVAEAVCKSTAAFSRSSQVQLPSKSFFINDKLCKTLTWSNCGTRGEATVVACQKFKLKDCPAQSQSQPQRSKERQTPRIIGGADAKPHEFPHIVRITRNDKLHCGGTIFNENYIITAAHCFSGFWGDETNNTFKVIAGDHNIKVTENTEQIRTVANAVWHENYNATALFANDIAVLLLDTPLELSENVLPPEMPQQDYNAQGELVTVAGWGFVIPGGNISNLPDILQKVDLTVGPCGFYAVNTSNVICGISNSGGETPCGGDSGGPLTKKLDNGCHLFLGIVSFGYRCIDILPSAYTKVSSYLGWINTNTEDC